MLVRREARFERVVSLFIGLEAFLQLVEPAFQFRGFRVRLFGDSLQIPVESVVNVRAERGDVVSYYGDILAYIIVLLDYVLLFAVPQPGVCRSYERFNTSHYQYHRFPALPPGISITLYNKRAKVSRPLLG